MQESLANPLLATPYVVETGSVSLSRYGEELCGDNVVVSRRCDSVIVVLSDGLGSGVKANILATLTSKIAGTMLKLGATVDEVVETVGESLPICKVRGIAYSTFTIMQVFYDGRVYMAEFDNPAVFYLHRGKITAIPQTERVIADKKVKEAHFQVEVGDFLVAISDGVVHAGIGAVLNLGWQWPNVARFLEKAVSHEENATSLAQRLADICRHLYSGKPGDDATIAAIHIRRPRHLTLAVGPPRSRQDDRRMARLLAAASGKKVVCGGMTSNIVSREWKVPLEVDLRFCSPTVPPLGRMPGVDLVTEGIITISGALEKLRAIYRGKGIDEVLTGEDGATLLARLLWESDEVHFLVGKAINPAHQNPELPPGLALKGQVISELTRCLEKAGKGVQVTSF